MPNNAPADMPELDACDLREAFGLLALKHIAFEQAMADPLYSRLIRARAAAKRTAEWQRTQQRTVVPVRRLRLGADGHPLGWCTQMAPGPLQPITQPTLWRP